MNSHCCALSAGMGVDIEIVFLSLNLKSMKANLKLTPTLSLKAIEAKARKAAVLATVAPMANVAPKTSVESSVSFKKQSKPKTQKATRIEREIRSIYNALRSHDSDREVVTIEYPATGSCKAMIRVFRREDLERQTMEPDCCREQLMRETNRGVKTSKVSPAVMYALYPDMYDAAKLGSVAIYGSEAVTRRSIILKQGTLFGRAVVSATIEMGRRPFVDVKLAP